MLKVLIADDEIKICKLIECLIDWQSIGLKIVSVVHDGLSALSAIHEHQPDIVITDIRMPNVNGLELIKKTKDINANINFIIISGYSDFTYAQQAIKYGVEDYLLKPIKKNELLSTLTKLVEKHREQKTKETETNDMLQQIHTNKEIVKTYFINELLDNYEVPNFIPNLNKINTQYYCNFNDAFYQIMVIQPICMNDVLSDEILAFFMSKATSIIQKEINYLNELIISNHGEFTYCVLNGFYDQLITSADPARRIRSELLGLKDIFSNLKIYVYLSSVYQGIEQLPLCMKEVLFASYDKLTSVSSIIQYEQKKENSNINAILSAQFRKDFLFSLETLNTSRISKLLTETMQNIIDKNLQGNDIYAIYTELIDMFSYGVKNYNFNIDYASVTQNLLLEFHTFTNLTDLINHVIAVINSKITQLQTEKQLENTRPIRLAKQYINDNYTSPLTLEMIGLEIGLNPSYFSSIFKKETGKNFIDYLNAVRIENAKQLLIENSLTVMDICEAVGFNDIKYFTKRFKKETGLSPSDYRKLYS